MLNIPAIKAISLDLDDTLWPIAPVIARAEQALVDWLLPRAPRTAAVFAVTAERLALRQEVQRLRPDIGHDLRTLRRETIRLGLQRSAEDAALVDAAYEVFIHARMQVALYDDARPALDWLAQRYPVVAVSNGNADVHQIGIGGYFHARLSAQEFGVGKPDARIFHAAAEAAYVQPHEVLHVGDDALLDVVGARRAGMQTAWLSRDGHTWCHDDSPPDVTITTLQALCRLLQEDAGSI